LHCWQKRTAGKYGQKRCEYFEASFHELDFPFIVCFENDRFDNAPILAPFAIFRNTPKGVRILLPRPEVFC